MYLNCLQEDYGFIYTLDEERNVEVRVCVTHMRAHVVWRVVVCGASADIGR